MSAEQVGPRLDKPPLTPPSRAASFDDSHSFFFPGVFAAASYPHTCTGLTGADFEGLLQSLYHSISPATATNVLFARMKRRSIVSAMQRLAKKRKSMEMEEEDMHEDVPDAVDKEEGQSTEDEMSDMKMMKSETRGRDNSNRRSLPRGSHGCSPCTALLAQGRH